MIYELQERKEAASLFEDWQETMVWSCLQGVMGKIYADSPKTPDSAVAMLGDFRFLAGKPDKALVLHNPEPYRAFAIMVPEDEEWAALIEEYYGRNAKRVFRYALKKEPDVFDKERLCAFVDGLPDGYNLKMIDETLFFHCRKISWCRDWVSQYKNYAMYRKYGLGAVILKDGEPVSGASSYSGYMGGIEVEIDTREDCRRKGLACVCGAKLILECLKRGWYPSWDAQNRWSAALAEKLGYHMDYEYAAYEVTRDV